MRTYFSSKKSSVNHYTFDVSVDEENPRWKDSAKKIKQQLPFDHSPVNHYTFLQFFAGGTPSKGKKHRKETIVVDEVEESVKERIVRSDAALQSSSSNYTLKPSTRSRCQDPCTSYHQESFNASSSQKAGNDRMKPNCTQQFHLSDVNEPVDLISDDDDDNLSRISSNDCTDAEGSPGERIPGHDKISSHEMEPTVVVYPEYVTYGENCYQLAKFSFFCSFIRLDVSEEKEGKVSHILKWKTADIISIESRWQDPSVRAHVCLRIKPEDPKIDAGILEVEFSVCDPCWASTQEHIKSLDDQYAEKWDVDLDSYESFEGITYLEGECDSISISNRDFQLLQPEKFINDTIVDFYIEHLKKIKPCNASVHFFNSFFFRKLADFDGYRSQSFDAKEAFQRVRKWTKKVNVFQMDYIFIPVNFKLHWSLIVICHPGEVVNFTDDELQTSSKVPCILHLDSIKGSHRGLEKCIRCYLWEEWQERSRKASEYIFKKFMDLRFLRLEAPQQQNFSDCALFMLHYMELFVKQAPINFSPLNNFISKDWFYPIEASLKRARIKRMIFELAKTNVQQVSSPGCGNKLPDGLKDEDEEEADVEILHETCNTKEPMSCENNSKDDTPIMVKPMRSEPMNDGCSDKSSYELKDEDEEVADIEILHETCNTKETNCENKSRYDTPIMVKPLRSKPMNDDDMDMDFLDSDINEEGVQSHCEEFSGSGDEEQDHLQMVLYDPCIDVPPIREMDETEDFEEPEGVTSPSETNKIDPIVTCINRSFHSLQLRDNISSMSGDDDVHETLMVEDSDDCSSDDVAETCVVEDTDSDDDSAQFLLGIGPAYQTATSIRKAVAGNSLKFPASKRRWSMVPVARKKLRGSL